MERTHIAREVLVNALRIAQLDLSADEVARAIYNVYELDDMKNIVDALDQEVERAEDFIDTI